MLDTKFYENAKRKLAFIYYKTDEQIIKYNVRIDDDIVSYEQFINGSKNAQKEIKVIQGKIPNLAYRFNVIMIILAKTQEEINLQNVQLVLDDGFNHEKQELIDQKKEETIEQLALAQIERERQFREQNKKLNNTIE